MSTSPPLPPKPHAIGSTRPLESANQGVPQPPDEDITRHRQKWTFSEVANRSHSQDIESKPTPKPPSRIEAHSVQVPASQSEASQLFGTPSVEGSAVALQPDSTGAGWGRTTLEHRPEVMESSSVLFLDLPQDPSGNNDLPTVEEMNTRPSDYCQQNNFISSPNEPAWKIPRSPMNGNLAGSQNPAVYAETKALNDAISRHTDAFEVVSQLVKHGIKDLSERLNQSTFEDHPLVTGGSSDIYRGQLTSGTEVAVKVLRFSAQRFSETSENIQDAARELHTWSKCKHPNVLPLYGLVTFRNRIGMVSPWMSEGTMPRYLKAKPEANRHNLCIRMCEGLSYLHDNGIVHGDLKGANVLISGDGTPVLTDFGNSTLKDQTLKFTQAAGEDALTVRWSAPEFIKDSGVSQRTKASDIYALGMTIYVSLMPSLLIRQY
ncbi:unnamed protein product [Rhizoctonia solani]|uniref:Protein kinase domain-containing protein n=1 Tax=Rhizoctonia solani TaxID=456999 RepID=A0A8H2XYD3_9AGAM|nr:unnamed protein product [Rhizoctonia solani]